MITKNSGVKQLPKSLQSTFSELNIANYLRKAGIVKGLGFSSLTVYCLIFSIMFVNKNWFRLLQSSKKEDLPGKNVVYRFLNNPRFGWRNFILAVSQNVISKMARLTSSNIQGRSYDMMVAHTSIIFTRYIVLSWESRLNTHPKSLGELFFIMCDEVKDLDYQTALTQLLTIMSSIMVANKEEPQAISIAEKVDAWLQQLPIYIRKLLLPTVANAF